MAVSVGRPHARPSASTGSKLSIHCLLEAQSNMGGEGNPWEILYALAARKARGKPRSSYVAKQEICKQTETQDASR